MAGSTQPTHLTDIEVFRNGRFLKSSNKKYLCFRWIQSWERKWFFRINKSSWSDISWKKDSFSVWRRQPWVNGGVSIVAFLGGSQVLGVVPTALAKKDLLEKTIREEIQVSTMSDRLNTIFKQADAFIALPGGLGILEEIFHISSWAQLYIHHKPIGLLNVNGFYDKLLSFLDQAMEQKFQTSSARQIIISTATAEQLIDQLQSFIPIIDPSMSRVNWSTKKSRKKLRLDLSLCLWNLCLLVLLIAYYFVLLFLIFL